MDEEIAKIVREHGWFAACINDATPPFTYTIGLMDTCTHPEMIVFGLDRDNAYALLLGLFQNAKSGKSYALPGIYDVNIGGDQHRLGFQVVHPTQHELYFGFAMGFLRNVGRTGELEAVQAYWPDSQGKFPFEPVCNADVGYLQPRLDASLTARELAKWRRRWS